MFKISVIIPAYNAEKTIKKCLDSIISQTYKNLEIIVVNDGSVDRTKEICESYNDERIRVINNTNHGVSYSRNNGIQISTGDYVTFVDADDYLEKKCYERIMNIFFKRKNIDFVRYNLKIEENKQFKFKGMYELSNKKYDFSKSKLNVISHFVTRKNNIDCFVMLLVIKSNLAKKIKFNEKLTMMEDVDFYMQLFKENPIGYFLDEKLYNYYVNSSSVTNSPNYYRKNIFGILDSNQEIKMKLKDMKCESIIPATNAANLNTILNTLTKLFKYDSKKYIEAVKKLYNDENFKELSRNHTKLGVNKEIFLNLILNNNLFMQKIYLSFLSFIKR